MPRKKSQPEPQPEQQPEQPKPIYQSRIVGHATREAGSFLANPDNWRVHPLEQQAAVNKSLEGIGWVQEVIVNVRSSEEWPDDQRNVETLVDGHLRVTLALRQGEQTPVPVTLVDLSPNQERMVLATLDPLAAMAATDEEKLEELMQSIAITDDQMTDLLASVDEGSAEEQKIKTVVGTLRPKKMVRVLISIPVEKAMDVQQTIDSIAGIDGVEVDYGAN